MKQSFLMSAALISLTVVAFPAFALDQHISDFRARSQTGYSATKPESAMEEMAREHPENLAPAAGGNGFGKMPEAEAQPAARILDSKFFDMKR